jgi:hypothetical protein
MKIPQRNSSAALVVVDKPAEVLQVTSQVKSVGDARVESVNDLLSKAYEKASQLELTEKEIAALTADFQDVDFRRGAGGNQDLIYIEHQSLRQRLNKVLGVGKWSLIIRRNWSEEFMAGRPPQAAFRVYVESVLIVRGCFVGEAIGDGVYYKANASGNYGDAYESAKSAALRRCCKEFGIGLQAWNKDWCEGWKARYPGFNRPNK